MEKDEVFYHNYVVEKDEDGIRILMERYGDRLQLYLYTYTHDFQEAEDLMIEAFSRVFAKRVHFTDNGFKAYLFKTARHLGLRYATKSRFVHRFGFKQRREEAVYMPELEGGNQSGILHICMGKILPEYREALKLVYFERLSYAEAAKTMGKKEKQVANFVHRGKQALRKLLEKEGITHAEF